jgi:hypothetical protein
MQAAGTALLAAVTALAGAAVLAARGVWGSKAGRAAVITSAVLLVGGMWALSASLPAASTR